MEYPRNLVLRCADHSQHLLVVPITGHHDGTECSQIYTDVKGLASHHLNLRPLPVVAGISTMPNLWFHFEITLVAQTHC